MQHASATHRPRHADRRPIRSPLSQAVLSACLLIGAGAMALPVHAQAPAQQGVQRFDIPAGPLDATLNRFAAQTGILLAIDGSLTAGQTSSGLSGSYGVSDGLAALLRGRSLEAVRGADGSYLLRPVATLPAAGSAGSTQLPTVNVTATAERPGTTEGTGSYTTRSTSTATKLNLSLRETPQTISVMTRQRIDDQGLLALPDVLAQTPGISIQHVDSERFSIFSRGYGIDNYQYDGIPTSLVVSTGATPQTLTDMAIYDRVEVLRGASGLMTGAGDPSGTINLVRKKPTADFKGYASASIGSWDLYRSEVDVSGPLNQAGSLRGRVVGAYQQNNSFIDYYKQKNQVFYGVVEADVTDSTLLTAGLDYQKNDPRGVSFGSFPLFDSNGVQTSFPRSTNAGARWSRREQETLTTFLSLDQKLANDWKLKMTFNHMDSDRSSYLASASGGFPNTTTGDGAFLYGGMGPGSQTQTGFDAQVQGPFELLGRRHELVLGFTSSRYKDSNLDKNVDISGRAVNIYSWNNLTPEPVIPALNPDYATYDTNIRQTGAYAAVRFKPTDDLSLILGARASDYRYDYATVYPMNPGWNARTKYQESGVVTPYAGVVYDLDDVHSVYASYTSIFKPQSNRDRTGATLKPREGDNYEAGIKSEFWNGALTTSAAVFQSKQNNLAEADPGFVVPGTQTTAYRAVQGAKTRGIDLEANGRLNPDWMVSASLSVSETEDAEGKRINTVAPANLVKLWTTYRLSGALNRLTIGGGMNWQSASYFTTTPWRLGKTVTARQDSYSVFNLMARYQFNDQLTATLNINNLFDKRYLSSLDTTFFGGYYGAPRNAMLTLKYQF